MSARPPPPCAVVERAKLSRDQARELLREFDLLILGASGVLFDGEAETYLREVLIAHEVGNSAWSMRSAWVH